MFCHVRHWRLVLLAVVFVFCHAVHAAEPLQDKSTEELVHARNELDAAFAQCVENDHLSEAMTAAEQLATIERELFARAERDAPADKEDLVSAAEQLVSTLKWLADRHTKLDKFEAAGEMRQEIVSMKTRIFGPQHWEVTDATLALADVERLTAMTSKQRERLAEAGRWNKRGVRLFKQGKFTEGLPLVERAAEAIKDILGSDHPRYATSLNNLAMLYHSVGDHAHAVPLYQQALEIWKEVLGEKHPDYANGLNNLAGLYYSMGDYVRAEPLFEEALETVKEVLGEKHADYAMSLNNLAGLYHYMGDDARSEPLLQQALEIQTALLGENSPEYAVSLNNLGMLNRFMGNYARAEPIFRKALRIRKEVLGEQHPDYAESLNNLAGLYYSMGDYIRAETLYQQALKIRKDVLGKKHRDYAQSLNDLAGLCQSMGDYVRAESLYQQALRIRKEVLGEQHPHYAQSLNDLATLYYCMRDYASAELLFQRNLETVKEVLGKKHPDYARIMSNLAGLYASTGDYARAEPLYHQALEIEKVVLGEKHPSYASSLNGLAMLYQRMGDYEHARPLYHQAQEIRKEVLGETHPKYAQSLKNLATLHESGGDDAGAELLYRQALEFARGNLNLCSRVQSERQQLVMSQYLRHYLDAYLSTTLRLERPLRDAYQYVLVWKGAVLARQRWLRLGQQSSDPEMDRGLAELQSTASRLATLVFAVPDPKKRDVWRRQVEELTERKEQLERELARSSVEVRREQARTQVTPQQLRQALPDNVVLVDFLEYDRSTQSAEKKGEVRSERCLTAFLVHSKGPIVRVELGPVTPITHAVQRWRRDFGMPADDGQPDPGQQLRTLVWQPLQQYTEDADIVLVSPDGVLNRLPLAALPGSEPETCLLEETALAIVPVPQLLPELLGKRTDGHTDDSPPNLLLVGDVDFDFHPSEEPTQIDVSSRPWSRRRAGSLQTWDPLPGTRAEILSIEDSFTRAIPEAVPRVLREGVASEAAVREAISDYEYLHFATHGFFAPSTVKSALTPDEGDRPLGRAPLARQAVTGFHPGLLSGIVLAGANRPAIDGDDGVLTALEVAQLDLRRAELVVLSACETGLGEVASGEGVLGLQRAFQVAGAKSVVTSLWKVEDQATCKLMERFYENYWTRRLGMLDSLREAQLWMLREGHQRGAVRLDVESEPEQSTRTPAYYWAGFALSGDWR